MGFALATLNVMPCLASSLRSISAVHRASAGFALRFHEVAASATVRKHLYFRSDGLLVQFVVRGRMSCFDETGVAGGVIRAAQSGSGPPSVSGFRCQPVPRSARLGTIREAMFMSAGVCRTIGSPLAAVATPVSASAAAATPSRSLIDASLGAASRRGPTHRA